MKILNDARRTRSTSADLVDVARIIGATWKA
jgi:hypothetical protein